MCTVLLPPGVNPIAVNNISYHKLFVNGSVWRPVTSSSQVPTFCSAMGSNSPSIYRDCGPLRTFLEGGQHGPPQRIQKDCNLNVFVRTFQALLAFVLPL
jgi:hypothetical protein